MWIMIIEKLPTRPSPPKMSIFWSTPNYRDYTSKNSEKFEKEFGFEDDSWEEHKEGRWIHFAGENILVLKHEFSIVLSENMQKYTNESHEFVPEDVASEMLLTNIEINADNRDIYGSALLDGCNNHQALMVLAGMDITIEDAEFPAIGWYRIKKEYGELFCEDWELTEQRENEKEFIAKEIRDGRYKFFEKKKKTKKYSRKGFSLSL